MRAILIAKNGLRTEAEIPEPAAPTFKIAHCSPAAPVVAEAPSLNVEFSETIFHLGNVIKDPERMGSMAVYYEDPLIARDARGWIRPIDEFAREYQRIARMQAEMQALAQTRPLVLPLQSLPTKPKPLPEPPKAIKAIPEPVEKKPRLIKSPQEP